MLVDKQRSEDGQFLSGRHASPQTEFKKGHRPWNEGKVWSEETRKKISESHKGVPLSKEHKKKMSIAVTKRYRNPEERKKHSERVKGVNNPMYGRVGKPPTYPKPYIVHGIPHILRSPWEKEIAFTLIEANIDYDYEVRFPIVIDGKECSYFADFTFMIDDKKYVVEPHNWFNGDDYQKFEAFNEQYPDITFIILSVNKPAKKICDIFIDWKDRNGLIDKIEEDLRCRGQR